MYSKIQMIVNKIVPGSNMREDVASSLIRQVGFSQLGEYQNQMADHR